MTRHDLFLLAVALLPPACPAACWMPDPPRSDVRFIAIQAGAPIEGTFHEFSGRICLDDASPEQGSINVSINTASVDMGLPEFDEAMRGAEFFDAARWPVARFDSTAVRTLGGGHYEAEGRFTIRDRTRDIVVPFTFSGTDDGAVVAGEIVIRRLDYDIGLGEWQDTRWVGNDVTLHFRVALRPE